MGMQEKKKIGSHSWRSHFPSHQVSSRPTCEKSPCRGGQHISPGKIVSMVLDIRDPSQLFGFGRVVFLFVCFPQGSAKNGPQNWGNQKVASQIYGWIFRDFPKINVHEVWVDVIFHDPWNCSAQGGDMTVDCFLKVRELCSFTQHEVQRILIFNRKYIDSDMVDLLLSCWFSGGYIKTPCPAWFVRWGISWMPPLVKRNGLDLMKMWLGFEVILVLVMLKIWLHNIWTSWWLQLKNPHTIGIIWVQLGNPYIWLYVYVFIL